MVYTSEGQKGHRKVFRTGRSQAVRIPKEYRFECDEVFIERKGGKIILTPRPHRWRSRTTTPRSGHKPWKEYFEHGTFDPDFPDPPEDLPPESAPKF
ncbi:MAG TPA: AbrB/MazE/SpoVT family DNA-binding domain-containing protein [Candidatus Binataceae bacterium]|nr:AbrB/MazE/SpoVT family DNA-binding domain-containing protein [Candidatus Binataceae bacterium]